MYMIFFIASDAKVYNTLGGAPVIPESSSYK